MGLVIYLTGCTTLNRPVEEYTLARAAFEAAQSADADSLAPTFFDQARQSYRNAERLFEEREFEKSKVLFNQSRNLFEKAENISRKKKTSSGDVL